MQAGRKGREVKERDVRSGEWEREMVHFVVTRCREMAVLSWRLTAGDRSTHLEAFAFAFAARKEGKSEASARGLSFASKPV